MLYEECYTENLLLSNPGGRVLGKKMKTTKNEPAPYSKFEMLDTFESLVSELSQTKPNRKLIQCSCEKLGLQNYDDLTDLMQVLLEKYPEFLSSSAKPSKEENKASI